MIRTLVAILSLLLLLVPVSLFGDEFSETVFEETPFRIIREIPLEIAKDQEFLITRLQIGQKGELYAASSWSHKIKVFSDDGFLEREIDFSKEIPFICPAVKHPQPGELAINSLGYLFVTAYWRDCEDRLQSGIFIFDKDGKFEHIIALEKIDVEDMAITNKDQILITGVDLNSGKPREFLWQIAQSGKTLMSYFSLSNFRKKNSNDLKNKFLLGNLHGKVQLITTIPDYSGPVPLTTQGNFLLMQEGDIVDRKIVALPTLQTVKQLDKERKADQITDGIVSIIQLSDGSLVVQRTHNNLFFDFDAKVKVSLKTYLYLHVLNDQGEMVHPNIGTNDKELDLGVLRSRDDEDFLYFVRLNSEQNVVITKVALEL